MMHTWLLTLSFLVIFIMINFSWQLPLNSSTSINGTVKSNQRLAAIILAKHLVLIIQNNTNKNEVVQLRLEITSILIFPFTFTFTNIKEIENDGNYLLSLLFLDISYIFYWKSILSNQLIKAGQINSIKFVITYVYIQQCFLEYYPCSTSLIATKCCTKYDCKKIADDLFKCVDRITSTTSTTTKSTTSKSITTSTISQLVKTSTTSQSVTTSTTKTETIKDLNSPTITSTLITVSATTKSITTASTQSTNEKTIGYVNFTMANSVITNSYTAPNIAATSLTSISTVTVNYGSVTENVSDSQQTVPIESSKSYSEGQYNNEVITYTIPVTVYNETSTAINSLSNNGVEETTNEQQIPSSISTDSTESMASHGKQINSTVFTDYHQTESYLIDNSSAAMSINTQENEIVSSIKNAEIATSSETLQTTSDLSMSSNSGINEEMQGSEIIATTTQFITDDNGSTSIIMQPDSTSIIEYTPISNENETTLTTTDGSIITTDENIDVSSRTNGYSTTTIAALSTKSGNELLANNGNSGETSTSSSADSSTIDITNIDSVSSSAIYITSATQTSIVEEQTTIDLSTNFTVEVSTDIQPASLSVTTQTITSTSISMQKTTSQTSTQSIPISTGGTSLEINRWYHVTAVYNYSSQTQSIYLDGILNGYKSNASYQGAPYNIIIGQGLTSNETYFDGLIDRILFVDRAMTADDIWQTANMSEYYTLDISSATDSSFTESINTSTQLLNETLSFEPNPTSDLSTNIQAQTTDEFQYNSLLTSIELEGTTLENNEHTITSLSSSSSQFTEELTIATEITSPTLTVTTPVSTQTSNFKTSFEVETETMSNVQYTNTDTINTSYSEITTSDEQLSSTLLSETPIDTTVVEEFTTSNLINSANTSQSNDTEQNPLLTSTTVEQPVSTTSDNIIEMTTIIDST
ncbi:hypothetical protein I4U23_001616 [Adineta vaga]|nr:hypothetical protein I4U23_001616 [Adineta vaga]